jgi:hypothetical protein
MTLEIQVLTWDRHKSVSGFSVFRIFLWKGNIITKLSVHLYIYIYIFSITLDYCMFGNDWKVGCDCFLLSCSYHYIRNIPHSNTCNCF